MARKEYPDTGEPIEVQAGYSPAIKDFELLKKLEGKFQSARESKKSKVPRWRRNEELYAGEFLKPFNLPKYKSRIEPNIVHSIVETMYSILTDRNPKVDLMPKREDQIQQARISQEAIESEMEKRKVSRAVAGMKRDGLIFGNGFLKCAMHNGKVEFIVPDPYTVYFDPLATNIENASCVIFATPTYISDIANQYPNGKYCKSEGKLNEYKSFIRQSDKLASPSGRVDSVEVETKSPIRTDSDNAETYGKGQALLKEAWYYEGGELYLATWCGNVILQREKAPYPFIPLVMFQNYKSSHSIWGKGEPEVVESLAVGSSITLSQAMDNLIYHGNPAVVMPKSMMKTPGNRPTDKPGQVFYTNGPHEVINRLPAGNISQSSLPMANSLIQLADTVSGVHDITQGRNPSGVTASRAIAQLQEASQQVIRTKEREVGQDAIISLYKYVLYMLKNNYSENIKVRTYSQQDSMYEFYEVTPYLLDIDMDFKYIPGSSMPESRASRFDQALDLVQMGLLDAEQFWRWTQKDISKEILEEMMEQKRMQQEQMEQQQAVMQQSTDPQEIEDAMLIQQMMEQEQGGGEQQETGQQPSQPRPKRYRP
tara:strand:+ start:5075 stop:6862 length:1788 start_codon:yes stop_codon:yes gene_type:complete